MKKTKLFVLSSILLCSGCLLYVQAKVHSMDYTVEDISGDRNALVGSEVTISLRNYYSGNDDNRFVLSLKDGKFTYQYKNTYELEDALIYEYGMPSYFDVRFYDENLTFDEKDLIETKINENYHFYSSPNVVCKDELYALQDAYLSVAANLQYDEYTGYYEQAYGSVNNIKTQLKIQSTDADPLVITRTTCEGLEEDYETNSIHFMNNGEYYSYGFEGNAYLMKERYYGMINIYPMLEGSAEIYRFDVTSNILENGNSLTLTPVKSIPITLGTKGFLYQYQNVFYTILQDAQSITVTKYDDDFNEVQNIVLPVPWQTGAGNYESYYANEDKLSFLYGNQIYTFDITTMQFVDELTIDAGKPMDIEDMIYRQGKYYILSVDVPQEQLSYSPYMLNQLVSVYENQTCQYRGLINIHDIDIKEVQGTDTVYKTMPTAYPLDYSIYYMKFTRDII